MKRNTRQREAIVRVLRESGRSLAPAEILDEAARDVPRLGLTTVYRQLRALLDEAAILQVDLPGRSPRFEVPATASRGAGQRPHFHCDRCEKVFPIPAGPGPLQHLAPNGFEVQRHDLTLHGRCALCAAGA